jgi:hypothetical protein
VEPSKVALRWMWIWITLGILIVIVVIGFLLGIASALESIERGLAEADHAVTGAKGDVVPLPTHIERINAALGRVDDALKPIPGQATTIGARLHSIRGTLGSVEGSLVSTDGSLGDTEGSLHDTSGSLVDTEGHLTRTSGSLVDTEGALLGTEGSLRDTSGSLRDTSGTLDQVEARLTDIRRTTDAIQSRLVLAQSARSLGTNAIWRRVRFLNGGSFSDNGRVNRAGLRFIERDTDGIRAQLLQVSKHLTSICTKVPVNLPALVQLGPGLRIPRPRQAAPIGGKC